MKQNIPSGKAIKVLTFDEGPESASGLVMNWLTPHHLDIIYRGNVPIIFKATEAFGNEVTVEKAQ